MSQRATRPVSRQAASRNARQRGVALLTALLVVALASIAAVAMFSREQYSIRLIGNIIQGDQAYLYTTSAVSWAAEVLRRDAATSRVDDLQEDWAQPLGPIPIEGGTVSGEIRDMQGRFNLNDLVGPEGTSALDVKRFRRLLTVLGLNPNLSDAVVDWIDPNSQVLLPDGAEDGTYLGLPVPYRAANAPMRSVTALRLIKGFSAAAVAQLEPYVSALPEMTGINVNTAPVPVLESLGDGIDKGTATALAAARRTKPFADVQSFLSNVLLSGKRIDPNGLTVASGFFRVTAAAQVGRGYAQITSLLQRHKDGKVTVLSRSREIR